MASSAPSGEDGRMTVPRVPARTSARRGAAGGLSALLLALAVSACSSEHRATSPGEVRELSAGAPARKAREESEEHLRAVVRAYDEKTPLALGLVAVNDTCAGGGEKEWLARAEDDRYLIRCSMDVTAYYGTAPDRIGDVLDAVLTAGDRDASDSDPATLIPFGHDDYRERLVGYYRDHGPNPSGPDAPEPTQLSDPAHDVSWDTVRSSARTRVEEPDPCADDEGTVARCLREPASRTVAELREEYGLVLRVTLSAPGYYEAYKGDGTSGTR